MVLLVKFLARHVGVDVCSDYYSIPTNVSLAWLKLSTIKTVKDVRLFFAKLVPGDLGCLTTGTKIYVLHESVDRYLTGHELMMLQGFRPSGNFAGTSQQLTSLAGNTITVRVVAAIQAMVLGYTAPRMAARSRDDARAYKAQMAASSTHGEWIRPGQ